MTEKPILFKGPMVRAILDGQKTQTRQIVKPQPPSYVDDAQVLKSGERYWLSHPRAISIGPFKLAYEAGDRLWARETWGVGCRPCPHNGWRDGIEYRADEAYLDEHDLLTLYQPDGEPDNFYADYNKSGWRPSTHMPRWMCRLLLDVKAVRVERLQDISAADAKAEGADAVSLADVPRQATWGPRPDFAQLWDSLNKKRGFGWETNPWVWIIEFERVAEQEQNND